MCRRVCKDSSLQRLLNGTNTSSDRASIQAEVTALSQEVTRIACRTTFGGKKVLSNFGKEDSLVHKTGNTVDGKIRFQVGANDKDVQILDLNFYKDDKKGVNTKNVENHKAIAQIY